MQAKSVIAAMILLSAAVAQAAEPASSPTQFFGWKAATPPSGSASFYNGAGAYAGRESFTGRGAAIFDGRGAFAGRVESSQNSTQMYDGRGAYEGRSSTFGGSTSFYDARGG